MYLQSHDIELPKKVIIGPGVINKLTEIIKDFRISDTALIVTGPIVYNIAGKKVEELLKEMSITPYVVIVKDSTIDTLNKVKKVAAEVKPNIVIGVGGGKSIDVAKYVAYEIKRIFISIPTSASHDGIASPFASIRGLGVVTSVKAKVPSAIIADTSIIAKAPKRLLLAGSGDLIAKLTAVLDWRLANRLRGEYYGDYAASLALLSAKHVISFSDIIAKGGAEAVRIVVEGLISSSVAMCIAGSTRPASGSEHLFSHALDLVANYPALHGEQVALGTIMMSYLHGRNWRKIKNVMKKLGLPVTAKELGIQDVKIVEALTKAHKIRPERYTILGDKGLTWEAAERLARVTGVIE